MTAPPTFLSSNPLSYLKKEPHAYLARMHTDKSFLFAKIACVQILLLHSQIEKLYIRLAKLNLQVVRNREGDVWRRTQMHKEVGVKKGFNKGAGRNQSHTQAGVRIMADQVEGRSWTESASTQIRVEARNSE